MADGNKVIKFLLYFALRLVWCVSWYKYCNIWNKFKGSGIVHKTSKFSRLWFTTQVGISHFPFLIFFFFSLWCKKDSELKVVPLFFFPPPLDCSYSQEKKTWLLFVQAATWDLAINLLSDSKWDLVYCLLLHSKVGILS